MLYKGKVLRGALRQVAAGDPNFKVPATADDPDVFSDFAALFKGHEDNYPEK